MKKLPDDIEKELKLSFSNTRERSYVRKKLKSLWSTALNVGAHQLAGYILIEAGGSVEKINQIFDSAFYGDPRDLIVSASLKQGKKIHPPKQQ